MKMEELVPPKYQLTLKVQHGVITMNIGLFRDKNGRKISMGDKKCHTVLVEKLQKKIEHGNKSTKGNMPLQWN
jgi:hypothetical protein